MTEPVSFPARRLPAATSDCSTCASARNQWAASLRSRADQESAPVSAWKFRFRRNHAMQNSRPIRILVVDDHFMVRMGLSASLNVEPDLKVVAEAANGEAALQLYRKHHPDVVMMDLRLPGMSGVD